MIPVALWSVLVLEGLLLFVGVGALTTGLRRQWRASAAGEASATGAPTVLDVVPQPATEQESTIAEQTDEPVTGTSASAGNEPAGTLVSA